MTICPVMNIFIGAVLSLSTLWTMTAFLIILVIVGAQPGGGGPYKAQAKSRDIYTDFEE